MARKSKRSRRGAGETQRGSGSSSASSPASGRRRAAGPAPDQEDDEDGEGEGDGPPNGPDRRRRAIVEILSDGPVPSQEELGQLLSRLGHDVTQATLSRDLRALGVVKGPEGYRLAAGPRGPASAGPSAQLVGALANWMLSFRPAGNLLVLRTPPGGASALALALDQAALSEAIGSVAGDDTVIVVAPTPTAAKRLGAKLARIRAGTTL